MNIVIKIFGITIAVLYGLLSASVLAKNPAEVFNITAKKDKTITVQSSLAKGAKVKNPDWAWRSENACYPQTQATKFAGHHVFFQTQIPAHAEMKISLIPNNKQQNLSLYAYAIATNRFYLPPKLPGAVSCEADYKQDRKRVGKKQDHTRSVRLKTIRNPYKVIIGVTGPAEAVSGDFRLKVTTR